jgi:Ser/Thr protein kinase RdoA (MazF antagonist)
MVPTSEGMKVLRRYRTSLSLSTIALEHSVLRRLAACGFPAPRMVESLCGETLVEGPDGRYVLFDFLEGGYHYHNYLLFPGQARRFAAISADLLGRLHAELEGFEPQGFNPDGFLSAAAGRERDAAWLLATLDASERNGRRNGRQGSGNGVTPPAGREAVRRQFLELECELEDAALPRVVIHADYGPYNILFRAADPPVVLDFEMARIDWRITDLVLSWLRFCRDRFGFKLGRMEDFVRAYSTRVDLTHEELVHLPAVWRYLALRAVILAWRSHGETGSRGALGAAQEAFVRLDWIEANEWTLLERLGTGLRPSRLPSAPELAEDSRSLAAQGGEAPQVVDHVASEGRLGRLKVDEADAALGRDQYVAR